MSHTINAVLDVLAGAVAGLGLPGLGEVVAAIRVGLRLYWLSVSWGASASP